MEWFLLGIYIEMWNYQTEPPNNCLWYHPHCFEQRKHLENFKTFCGWKLIVDVFLSMIINLYFGAIVGEVLAEI